MPGRTPFSVAHVGIPLRPGGTRGTIAGDLDFEPLASRGKASGESDIEALAALAPDQIGNDTWANPPDFRGLGAGAIAPIEVVAPIANSSSSIGR